MNKVKIQCYYALLFILALVLVQNQGIQENFNQNFVELETDQKTLTITVINEYTERDPIAIFNDSAFGSTGYDFPGTGTPSDPYLIDSYNITDSTTDLIQIENTTKYFKIANCHLDCESSFFYGIYLVNVTHGTIEGNIITNSGEYAIEVADSKNIIISDNTFHDVAIGISFIYSNNSVISNNMIYDIEWNGIHLDNAYNNTLLGNTLYNCFSDNIFLDVSDNNTVMENIIFESNNIGISIFFSSSNNSIYRNNIYNNNNHGLEIDIDAEDNLVKFNNFVNNNIAAGSQASDNAVDKDNVINSNYWDDWSGTGDYSIDGAAANKDSSPLLSPVLPIITIISPLPQEYDTDTITVLLSGSATISQYWYYIEGIDSQNQTWTDGDDRVLSNGVYTLHAYGNDTLDNIGSLSVSFTIEKTTTTTTTEASTTTSKTGAFPGLIPVILVFVGLVMIYKRRTNV